MTAEEVINIFEKLGDPARTAGLGKVGVKGMVIYGVSIPDLRALAKEIGKDHELSLELRRHPSREARILASMIEHPRNMTEKDLDEWALSFDSWEVCDQAIMNLFEKTPFSWEKAAEWSARDEEFVKRGGFVLMARLAVADKKAPDRCFVEFFPHIISEAHDSRTGVKKAVSWALRQIGKRNTSLAESALKIADELAKQPHPASRWIASDARRDIENKWAKPEA